MRYGAQSLRLLEKMLDIGDSLGYERAQVRAERSSASSLSWHDVKSTSSRITSSIYHLIHLIHLMIMRVYDVLLLV